MEKNSPFFGAPLCHPPAAPARVLPEYLPPSAWCSSPWPCFSSLCHSPSYLKGRRRRCLAVDRGPKRGTSEDLSGVHMYSVYIYIYLHYITFHSIPLHYIPFHFIPFHYITLHTYIYIYIHVCVLYILYILYIRTVY